MFFFRQKFLLGALFAHQEWAQAFWGQHAAVRGDRPERCRGNGETTEDGREAERQGCVDKR